MFQNGHILHRKPYAYRSKSNSSAQACERSKVFEVFSEG